jgi:hypothetical protein
MRENAQAKGRRYLTEGRLTLCYVTSTRAKAICKGQGRLYTVGRDAILEKRKGRSPKGAPPAVELLLQQQLKDELESRLLLNHPQHTMSGLEVPRPPGDCDRYPLLREVQRALNGYVAARKVDGDVALSFGSLRLGVKRDHHAVAVRRANPCLAIRPIQTITADHEVVADAEALLSHVNRVLHVVVDTLGETDRLPLIPRV